MNEFDIDVTIDRNSLKGILLVLNCDNCYAITYGMSSSLVQKYCDSDFAMNIAKKIKISKVKRKAGKFLNGSTNSLVKTLSNSNIIVVDKGESVVNLEIIPDENVGLGKCIGIGKSLKLNLSNDINDIENIFTAISQVEACPDERPIPLFVIIKDKDLILNIWDYLNISFANNIMNANFSIDEMNIIGSSIYFDDNFKLELCYRNNREEISLLNTDVVRNFIEKYQIKSEKILDYIKIRYTSDGDYSFSKSLKEVVTYDFEYKKVKYVIYDGNIYYYNDDFYNSIIEGISKINFENYNKEDDKTKKWYDEYLKRKNMVDVHDTKENKQNKKTTYREQAINNELSQKYELENLDRNLVDINKDLKYKIEIADLGKTNEILYAVKIGSPRDFCYAIDQSNLSVDALISRTYNKDEKIEEYKTVKKIGLWLYISSKKKIHNNKNEIQILELDSIMFLNKLVDWSNKVISAGFKPVVKINYYN